MDTGEGRHWAAESLVPDQCLYLILIVNKQRPRGPPVTRSAAPSKYFSPRKHFLRWWALQWDDGDQTGDGDMSNVCSKIQCSARRREGITGVSPRDWQHMHTVNCAIGFISPLLQGWKHLALMQECHCTAVWRWAWVEESKLGRD